jgi:hypothetical protein
MKDLILALWNIKRGFSILVLLVFIVHALMYYPEFGLVEIFIAVLIANLILFVMVYLMTKKMIN